MKSPIITFRLSQYQLARGLLAIKRLDHTYQPSSIHQLVKLIYLDYCAKMSIHRSDEIPPYIWNDLRKVLPGTIHKTSQGSDTAILNKLSILQELNKTACIPNNDAIAPIEKPTKIKNTKNALTNDIETDSVIDTVQDFAFLKELSGELEDNDE